MAGRSCRICWGKSTRDTGGPRVVATPASPRAAGSNSHKATQASQLQVNTPSKPVCGMKYFAPLILALLCATESAFAADPLLTRVMPRGATRGAEIELTFLGQRLSDAQEILFYEPGITVKEVKGDGANACKATVTIA